MVDSGCKVNIHGKNKKHWAELRKIDVWVTIYNKIGN